jgi:hypothetical protein
MDSFAFLATCVRLMPERRSRMICSRLTSQPRTPDLTSLQTGTAHTSPNSFDETRKDR